MRIPCRFVCVITGLFFCLAASAQAKRFDSAVSMGKVEYRVSSGNKNADRNETTIRLKGFQDNPRGYTIYTRGLISSIAIDDLNNDGYPDLLIFVYGGANGEFGSVYAFASSENKSLMGFILPDVQLDGKLSPGYKGHDEFSMMEGVLVQKFPLYNPNDDKDKPTGGRRIVMYKAVPGERGGLKFVVQRFYDVK